jgi:serine/threonine-protein kinase
MADFVFDDLRRSLRDHYDVTGEIGRGGMATVYAAQDLKHDRRVAIKVLSPDLAASLGAERFAREIRIAARLQHPNILGVFDSGISESGLLYYVMPFVDGESLRDRMTRETHIAIDDTISIACEVAEALAYAHAQGVVHRDIKPENILLQAGRVLVADFGIARATERSEAERLTGTGVSLGTAAYMSPEQAAGDVVDARSDVYALGCTVYEMLAGQPPFSGPNPMAIMARHTLDAVPSIRVVRPAVPEPLEDAVRRALEKVPADRFQSMEEFKLAVLGEAPAGGSHTTPRFTARYRTVPEPAASRFSPRARWGVGVAMLAVLVATGAALARQFGKKRPTAGSDASRVAVMYFDDQSRGPLRFLADGLTESLIDRLSDVAALDVVTANGVRPYRGRDVAPDSVGRALGVGSIVRGSVEPAGDNVRVSVSLVDAVSGADIGRKSLTIDTAQTTTAQTQLASQVVDFLRQELGAEIRLRADRAGTSNTAAWTLLERAEKLRKDADSLSAAGARDAAVTELARGDSLLAKAEQLDPRWVKIPARRAAVAEASALLLGNRPQLVPVTDSGLAYADRALALQPNDPDALEAKGELQYIRYIQRAGGTGAAHDRLLIDAESTLVRAVNENKNQAGAWSALSSLYYSKPDIQAANRAAGEAYRADAYLASAKSILTRLFWTSHDLEEFPEALKWCDEGHRRFAADPFFTACRLWMYTTRYQKPDIDSAWIYADRYVALTAAPGREYARHLSGILLGGALARANLPDSARRVLERARAPKSVDTDRELEGYEAVMRVILGDQDEAVRLIADYLTVHPDHRRGFATRTGWWWRDLQTNQKFKALLAGAR